MAMQKNKIDWSEKEKAKCFDKLAELYYFGNFGTAPKAEIDLLMFSFYLDRLGDNGKPIDDYVISKQLGILQTNVRQLKKKKQLKYPRTDYNWQDVFVEYAKNAALKNGEIVINVPDPNVQIELEHEIEELGYVYDCSLNSKLIRLSPSVFVELLIRIENGSFDRNDKKTKELEKKYYSLLNEKYRSDNGAQSEITKENLKDKLRSMDFGALIEAFGDLLPGSTLIKPLLSFFNSNK